MKPILPILLALLALLVGCGSEPGFFVDHSAASGVDFRYESGASGRMYLPEVAGGGLALFDADGDGDLDLYFANGNANLPEGGRQGSMRNRFYRNVGEARFVDATEDSGLGDPGYGMGVAVGDMDNDGDVDLYLSNFGSDRLYSNEGEGHFVDVTERAGIAVDGFSASAAFLDYDRDGLLDIFVSQYTIFNAHRQCRGVDGRPDYCGPNAFDKLPDVLLHNEGGGRFRDVSEAAGLRAAFGAGLGLAVGDFNDDGWIDVYVANDGDANQLWINDGDGSFSDRAIAMGVAVNMHGRAEAGMGVSAADFDGDAHDDLFMTHLRDETNTLYRKLGSEAAFTDVSGKSRLGEASKPFTGFGTVAFDLELDGDLDLAVVNGRVKGFEPLEGVRLEPPLDRLAEPNQIYLNDGKARFSLLDALPCAFCDRAEVSRGLAAGDLDDDGDLDLVLSNVGSPARVFLNTAPREGAWLRIRAIDPRLRRDAIGARVVVEAGGRRLARTLTPATSYLSSGDMRLHFGLGAADRVAAIAIRWPDGLRERFTSDCVDCDLLLERGAGRAE